MPEYSRSLLNVKKFIAARTHWQVRPLSEMVGRHRQIPPNPAEVVDIAKRSQLSSSPDVLVYTANGNIVYKRLRRRYVLGVPSHNTLGHYIRLGYTIVNVVTSQHGRVLGVCRMPGIHLAAGSEGMDTVLELFVCRV